MCVIVYKPSGVEFPNDTILRTCFDHNSDGAGFMLPDNGMVHIRKGFMKYEDFDKAITPYKNAKDLPVVMHFRISTHAGVNPEMTQPFPLTSKTRKLKSTDTISRIGVAHNGVIDMTRDAKTISDTALFIKRYMSFLIKDVEYYKNEKNLDIIEKLIGSRMAILSSDGHCELLGSGWKMDEGIWYSNDSYKPYTTKYTWSNKNWSKWYGSGWDYEDIDYENKSYDDLDGYLDDETWNSIAYANALSGEMSDDELDEWVGFRESCQDREDSRGATCYFCPYAESCYAI